MGVLGKTVLMMLFGGAAWGPGNPLLWWGFRAKTRLRKLSVPRTPVRPIAELGLWPADLMAATNATDP